MFILGQMRGGDLEGFYEFVPYHYGPYSQELAADLRELVAEGLVAQVGDDSRAYDWELTREGAERANEAKVLAAKPATEYLGRLVRWIHGVSLSTLLHHVYRRFPEYARKGNDLPKP